MIQTRDLSAPDGAATAVRFAGASGPALVFVHGVGSTAAIWDRQLDALGARYQCAAVELRGNGVPKPEPEPTLITRAGYAADVLAVCDALGFERVTIVGCSLGGVVAFELWGRAPERIASMMIVGSFARYPNAQEYARTVSQAVLAAGDMNVFAHDRVGQLGAMPPERRRETLDQMALKSVASYLAATQATWTGDYTGMLGSIAVPVLVTCGENDTIAPPALARAIADGIPNAHCVLVPGAGHVANADNAPAFDELLTQFMDVAIRV